MIMSDNKTLLELAAKAAGVILEYADDEGLKPYDSKTNVDWNPLTDDGDALRLAVKLGLHITVWPDAIGIGTNGKGYEELKWTDDPYAATRRAIVRAAAAIGESM